MPQKTEFGPRAEGRLVHLGAVLQAIRGINQLAVEEHDPGRLVQSACDSLVEARGYHAAWAVMLDANRRPVTFASAGLGEHAAELRHRLDEGSLPQCARRAIAATGVQCVRSPATACGDCPLAVAYQGRAGLSVQLPFDDRTMGLLAVSVPLAFAEDAEERALLGEVASGLAISLRDPSGTLTGYQSTSFDVTAARRTEEPLRLSEEDLRLVFHAVADGIVLIDPETGRFELCNRAMCQLLGCTEEERLRLGVEDIHPPSDQPHVQQQLARVGEAAPATSPLPAPPVAFGRRGRILIVDDEAGIRAIMKRILGKKHEVVTASSGEEAKTLLETDLAFDLLFVDLMMPRMSGMDLHGWLRQRDATVADRVVFVTGGVFTSKASDYLASVGNRRLDKPFEADALRLVAEEAIAASRGGQQT